MRNRQRHRSTLLLAVHGIHSLTIPAQLLELVARPREAVRACLYAGARRRADYCPVTAGSSLLPVIDCELDALPMPDQNRQRLFAPPDQCLPRSSLTRLSDQF
jgi:hypothetical protein